MRPLPLLALAVACAAAPPAAAQILSGNGTAVIDGVVDNVEWIGAAAPIFPVNLPGGGTTPGGIFVMNDATHLYLAAVVVYTGGVVDFSLEFDANEDQVLFTAGDDTIGLASNGSPRDGYRTASMAPSDTSGGGSIDVVGAATVGATSTTIEVSHPLDSADGRDIAVAVGDFLHFSATLRLFPNSTTTAYPGPSAGQSARIEILPEPQAAASGAAACLALVLARKRALRPRAS